MDNSVSLEELKHVQQMLTNNNWQSWVEKPQWLICAILTTDLDKAEEFMKSKNVVKEEQWRRNEKHWITSNNERWVWRRWDSLLTLRGQRFCKIAVDQYIRKDIFDKAIHAWTPRCFKMEIF